MLAICPKSHKKMTVCDDLDGVTELWVKVAINFPSVCFTKNASKLYLIFLLKPEINKWIIG